MTKYFTSIDNIEELDYKIYFLRGRRVMLDRDLAFLYGVETKVLNQSVNRNISRFPEDFMFQMTKIELENWKSQFVTSSKEKMGLRKKPLAFTEQGIVMLSSVLKSERAIQVNIQIMRTFTKIREMLVGSKDLQEKIDKLESKYDSQFTVVFKAIKQLLSTPDNPNKKNIGFNTD